MFNINSTHNFKIFFIFYIEIIIPYMRFLIISVQKGSF